MATRTHLSSARASHRRRTLVGAASAALLFAPLAAAAQGGPRDVSADPVADDARAGASDDGETVVVTGRRNGRLEEARKALDSVAGGTALIDNSAAEDRGLITNADLLKFQPGIFAQAGGGSDGIKISIRGSAINRGSGFFRSGALFEFDGLPVSGPGGTPYELFEPLGNSRTEVLRGANGFDRGSVTLGGVINYVSLTGKDFSSPLGIRLEGGSYGYRKYQVSSGGDYGPLDYYVSVTGAHRDGYQQQTRGRSFGVQANLGYEIAPTVRTRFFFRYRRTANQSPGLITVAQVEADPRVANPQQVALDADRIQPGSFWIANKTEFDLSNRSALELGVVYHDYPIDQQLGVNRGRWGYTDLTGSLRYTRTDTLFGRDSSTVLGLLYTTHPDKAFLRNYVRVPSGATARLPVGTLVRDAYYKGTDGNLFLTNESEPIERLHLLFGGSLIRVKRGTGVTYPVIPDLTTPYRRESWDYGYRAGFRYELTPEVQLFGNVSRSVEPPNDWAFLTTPPAIPAGYPAQGLSAHGLNLKDQTATTYELGTRGTLPLLGGWNLSVYRADIRNELLSVVVDTVLNVTAESNASPTRHQGVEVALDTPLWRDGAGSSVSLRQSYTYNDFTFRRDPTFGRNELPGIPKHIYQAELAVDHASGFYGNVNTSVAAKNWLDYANSVSTRGYQLFGGTVGLKIPETSYRIFADFQNITNKHYGAVVSPAFNLNGSDRTNPRLTPGDGFTVIGGVSVAL